MQETRVEKDYFLAAAIELGLRRLSRGVGDKEEWVVGRNEGIPDRGNTTSMQKGSNSAW